MFWLIGSNGKIVGGSNTSPGEIPYQVSIYDNATGLPQYHCGGVIFSEVVL